MSRWVLVRTGKCVVSLSVSRCSFFSPCVGSRNSAIMTSFDPAEFFKKNLVRSDWLRLTKTQLLEVAAFQEIEVKGDLKKLDILNFIIEQLGFTCAEAEERKTKLEIAELERKAKVEVAQIEEQGKLDRAKLDLEREKLKSAENQYQRKHEARFDISRCLKIMPRFNTEDVDVFFDAFEKIANELEWPEEKWPILVQSAFVGKAQEAYTALNASQSAEYKVIKEAVLHAYEVVPEGHRQTFRSLRRKPGETYLDLVRQQEASFEKWLKGSEAYTFNELKELILLEQFKNSVRRLRRLRSYEKLL